MPGAALAWRSALPDEPKTLDLRGDRAVEPVPGWWRYTRSIALGLIFTSVFAVGTLMVTRVASGRPRDKRRKARRDAARDLRNTLTELGDADVTHAGGARQRVRKARSGDPAARRGSDGPAGRGIDAGRIPAAGERDAVFHGRIQPHSGELSTGALCAARTRARCRRLSRHARVRRGSCSACGRPEGRPSRFRGSTSRFANSDVLWFAVPAMAAAWLWQWRRRRTYVAFSAVDLLRRINPHPSVVRRLPATGGGRRVRRARARADGSGDPVFGSASRRARSRHRPRRRSVVEHAGDHGSPAADAVACRT